MDFIAYAVDVEIYVYVQYAFVSCIWRGVDKRVCLLCYVCCLMFPRPAINYQVMGSRQDNTSFLYTHTGHRNKPLARLEIIRTRFLHR
jgi:hypothetical protein